MLAFICYVMVWMNNDRSIFVMDLQCAFEFIPCVQTYTWQQTQNNRIMKHLCSANESPATISTTSTSSMLLFCKSRVCRLEQNCNGDKAWSVLRWLCSAIKVASWGTSCSSCKDSKQLELILRVSKLGSCCNPCRVRRQFWCTYLRQQPKMPQQHSCQLMNNK